MSKLYLILIFLHLYFFSTSQSLKIEKLKGSINTIKNSELNFRYINDSTAIYTELSNEKSNLSYAVKKQDEWLEKKLHESKNDWLIVSFHHPIFPPAGRNHYTKQQKEKWINLFNKYNVDLVLQGHDHSYVRGHIYKPNFKKNIQTVYVTSVSGPKQYPINKEKLLNYKINNYKTDFIGENGQFFQKITINKNCINKCKK